MLRNITRHRNTLISTDNFTTKEPNTKPKKILPILPMNTLARGILRGKNPRHAHANEMLIKAISGSFLIKKEKNDSKPNATTPVNPAIQFIPSIKYKKF